MQNNTISLCHHHTKNGSYAPMAQSFSHTTYLLTWTWNWSIRYIYVRVVLCHKYFSKNGFLVIHWKWLIDDNPKKHWYALANLYLTWIKSRANFCSKAPDRSVKTMWIGRLCSCGEEHENQNDPTCEKSQTDNNNDKYIIMNLMSCPLLWNSKQKYDIAKSTIEAGLTMFWLSEPYYLWSAIPILATCTKWTSF